jgi:hypothetical protein
MAKIRFVEWRLMKKGSGDDQRPNLLLLHRTLQSAV